MSDDRVEYQVGVTLLGEPLIVVHEFEPTREKLIASFKPSVPVTKISRKKVTPFLFNRKFINGHFSKKQEI